jgi:protein SEY1
MWEHQVGLYQGANLGLLKTVLEVNLSLFGKKARDGFVWLLCHFYFYLTIGSNFSTQSRTLLLFVIRDHSTTPLSNLQSTLIDDLNKIWDTIAKPSDLSHAKLSDYFDLAFTALPHKRLAAPEFENEVVNLRMRFFDPQNENYVFKPQYHKRIPADGVAFYMESIWVRSVLSFRVDSQGDTLIGTSTSKQGSRSSHTTGAPRSIPLR